MAAVAEKLFVIMREASWSRAKSGNGREPVAVSARNLVLSMTKSMRHSVRASADGMTQSTKPLRGSGVCGEVAQLR